MKTNKKVQKNNVQKSEKETAVKVTALAIIPKPMKLLTSQNMPTATEVTETPEAATAVPEMATVPTVTEGGTAASRVQDTACNGHSRNRP
ncbi:Chromosome (plasmid) partitioning protein ParB / Stage 0 sporulation protein J [Bacteroides xylanisolvens SD CC 2a]|nr:Chromosome (plasmid) partitioning protein ParB / Stage 0 sporulation protein J [Bacteroides xylanisolvens SD CC 2a]